MLNFHAILMRSVWYNASERRIPSDFQHQWLQHEQTNYFSDTFFFLFQKTQKHVFDSEVVFFRPIFSKDKWHKVLTILY